MTTSVPPPRPALAALPAYKPGRSAEVAMQEHSLASAHKLASNENPFDPLPAVRAAIADASAGITRYPDHRAAALREALADRLGLTPSHVSVGCGSVGLLQQLLLSFADPGDEVLYAWRTFEAYPIYTVITGATPVTTPLRFGTIDMAALTKAVTERTRLVLVTSPNNPTGTAVRHDELVALLEAVPERCLVVLDEAYHEYITGRHAPRALELLRQHPNLAVLRTFSKAYGLAALRVGYLLGHPQVVSAVDQTLIPFAVNGLGQVAALASLEHDHELRERVDATIAERDRVQRALRELGFSTPDAQANFLWLPAGSAAAALTLKLETRGVVTRPFTDEGIRVTTGAPHENDRFLDAFEGCAAPLDLAKHWELPVGERAQEVQSWIDRIDAVDARLVAHATTPHSGHTDPDPGGEEVWDANQVWAHLAEIGGFWLTELEQVVDAASDEPVPFGRVKTDPARIAAIAQGRRRDVTVNLETTRRNLDSLRAYLAGLSKDDWRRVGRHSTLGEMDVARQLSEFHVGHAEQHLDQLDALAAAEGSRAR
jgi:histidinol-phosphate aminotransferase